MKSKTNNVQEVFRTIGRVKGSKREGDDDKWQ